MIDDIDQSRRAFLQSAGLCGAGVAIPGLFTSSSLAAAGEGEKSGQQVIDFAHSYLRWTLDTKLKPPKTVSKPLPMTLNRVRMPIEATIQFKSEATGDEVRYALGAECRTEQVWVKRDIWHDPNASMCLFGSEKHCLIEKHWARADFEATLFPPKLGAQPERQVIDPADAFAEFSIDVKKVGAVELENTPQILEAFSGSGSLVAQTEYRAAGYVVTLEYPVKTANFSERERYYQVDTGPILFPIASEIGTKGEPLIKACRLAFVAHNSPDWAEFIVCVPTPLRDDLRVHHYSQSVRVEDIRNRLFRVT